MKMFLDHCGIRDNFHSVLHSVLYRVGTFTEHRPLLILLLTFFLTMLGASGVTKLTLETEAFNLWVPTSSVAYRNYIHNSETFQLAGDRELSIILSAAATTANDNVLSYESLTEVLALHHNLTGSVNVNTPKFGGTFNTLCSRVDVEMPCNFGNILSVS